MVEYTKRKQKFSKCEDGYTYAIYEIRRTDKTDRVYGGGQTEAEAIKKLEETKKAYFKLN